jgi:hypothetical protein
MPPTTASIVSSVSGAHTRARACHTTICGPMRPKRLNETGAFSRDHTPFWRLRARRDDPRLSEVTQPPLIAQAALHLANHLGSDRLGRDRLERYAGAAQTNVDWLFENRVAPGRKLISVIDPIETGMDSLIARDQILERILPAPRAILRDVVDHSRRVFTATRHSNGCTRRSHRRRLAVSHSSGIVCGGPRFL